MRDLSVLANLNIALIQTSLAWHDRKANLEHFESLLEQVAAQRVDLDQGNLQLLERGFDNLHGLVARVGAHRSAPMPTELIAEFESRAHPQTPGAAAPA